MAQAQVSGKTTRTRRATTAQAKKPAAAKKTPVKAASPARKRTVKKASVTGDKRHAMICETAFYYAEQRGFQGDMAMDDWLRAEAEVDARLVGKRKAKAA